jgi:hypothetical protein
MAIDQDQSGISKTDIILNLASGGQHHEANHYVCNHLRPYGLCLGPSRGSDGDGFDEAET